MDVRNRILRSLGLTGIGLFLFASLAKAQPSSCSAPSPGTYCGVSVGISPFVTGGPFGGFQSRPGTGFQTAITVTFSPPVAAVSVTALDPDFPGNRMDAFDAAGAPIGSAAFAGDGRPGVFTTSAKTLTGAGIARVVLVPDPADYVAYSDLSFTPSAPPLKLQAVDPYPALIGSDGVTSDPERRAVADNEVAKAAADGATLLLLRASGLQPGQVVFSVDGGNTVHDGGVSADGNQRLASVTVPVVQTSQGMEAFAFYWVPDDLDNGLLSQSVPLTARLVPASGEPSEKSLTITLVRPPVLLVHGIWSDATTWKEFPLFRDNRFTVKAGDYEPTHASHFATNQVLVHRFVDQALFELRAKGVAATRVDYVAHSMGGILGRLHTQVPSYSNPLNFSRGDLHKLFTLDTPHTGTPAALLAFALSLQHPGFVDFCRLIRMPIHEGAVEDLATGSFAIAGIKATPLPAHALVGTGGSDLTDVALTQVPGPLGLLFTAFALFDQSTDIFAGLQHDGIVGRRSQEGGMPASAISPPFRGFDSLHTRVTKNGEYSNRVIDLLLTPVTDPAFSNFPAPSTLGFAARSSRLALSNDPAPVEIQGALRIDLPAGSSVLAGGSLPIAVSAQNDFVPVRVATLSLASSRLFDAPPFTTTLDIPQDTAGDVLVLAAGVDAAGAIGYSGIVTIHVQPGSPLNSLEAMDATPILFGAGDSRNLAIVGHFDDGVLRDVTSPTAGTSYASADPGIVTVSDSGLLTAVAPGNAEVVVENAGVSATVAVTVLANRSPLAVAGPDRTVECSSPAGTAVALNGGVSVDPDGDPLTFAWSGPFGSATGATPTVTLPLGTSPVQLTVDDGRGGSSSDTLEVTVRDTTAPVPGPATASPSSLWPPNHKMVAVTIQASAQDACSAAPSCAIQRVTANEPSDGDVEITGPLSLRLRAERLGGGTGRIYTVEISCRDAAGNAATTTTTVRVPHDQGN